LADLLDELKEDLQKERYTKLAKKFGPHAIILVVVLLASVGIYQWRVSSLLEERVATGKLFTTALSLLENDKGNEAFEIFNQITKDGSEGYNKIAALRKAQILVEQGKIDDAVSLYDSVSNDNDADPAIRSLTSLLASYQLVEADRLDEAESRLKKITKKTSPWRHSAIELQGIHAMKSNDRDKAVEIFATLWSDKETPSGIRARAQKVLASLRKQ